MVDVMPETVNYIEYKTDETQRCHMLFQKRHSLPIPVTHFVWMPLLDCHFNRKMHPLISQSLLSSSKTQALGRFQASGIFYLARLELHGPPDGASHKMTSQARSRSSIMTESFNIICCTPQALQWGFCLYKYTFPSDLLRVRGSKIKPTKCRLEKREGS